MSDEADILAANAAYYQVFVSGDFPGMRRIWADAEDISCVHPGWPALLSREEILESYRQILSNPNQERIEHRHDTVMISGEEARVFCVEFVGGAALAATNMFRRVDGAWRMIHHQASSIAELVAEDISEPPTGRLS